MKELKLKVWVKDEYTCHKQCPFLNGDECLLFKTELEETQLPNGFCWQDETEPTRQRDHRCIMATS